ncbi:MAG: hypothetical protein ACE5DR_04055 [Thermodesulfobacteriota bacterium]
MKNFTPMPQRGFLPERLIAGVIADSNNFDPDEDIGAARGFVLFDSAAKRVWLMATKLRLYCLSDERRAVGPSIEWSISRSKLYCRGTLSIEIKERKGERDLVDIGYRKGNAFSPALFISCTPEERIRALIKETMG